MVRTCSAALTDPLRAALGHHDAMARHQRGHRARSHTADVILEAWGPDLASCCEEAVGALVATFVAAAEAGASWHRRVHLAPVPPGSEESLLLAVLEEVIFTLDTAEAVPVSAEVSAAGDGGLDMVMALVDRAGVEGTGAMPKAVSRSGLRVDVGPGRVGCTFLVDL